MTCMLCDPHFVLRTCRCKAVPCVGRPQQGCAGVVTARTSAPIRPCPPPNLPLRQAPSARVYVPRPANLSVCAVTLTRRVPDSNAAACGGYNIMDTNLLGCFGKAVLL